ncbi:Cholera toxin secretion protein epsC [Serratia quinivorans]|uniref:type II secretion system protein N n=1 Tax=Serratia quinivorans TaxID=137545 RepID=UPI002177B34B|nr:type II secretion system protein N [Serratia quinivorans]CAI1927224.1 Cholera toxin secretion protein epsC [Serratia quinivorans]
MNKLDNYVSFNINKWINQKNVYLIIFIVLCTTIVIRTGLNVTPLLIKTNRTKIETGTPTLPIEKVKSTKSLPKFLLFQKELTTSTVFKEGRISLDNPILQQAPITALNLRLNGLLRSSIEENTLVIIEQNKKQHSYAIDETLANTSATIVRVFPDRVIIKNNENYEAILLN